MRLGSKNIKHFLLPFLFLGMLGLHLIDDYLDFIIEPPVSEARTVAEKPIFNISFLDPFPRKFEAYYNDHFNWRNYFVKASTYLNYYTFKKSALPDKVVIGKNGWLFKAGHQLDAYRGKFRFTVKELAEIKTELERRKAIVEQFGAKYYLAIPPLKHRIYPEFLPDNIQQINTESHVDQLVTYLNANSSIQYIDLLAPILARKQKGDVLLYLKTDHHWNQYASLIASQTVLDFLRKDFPIIGAVSEADYTVKIEHYDGMLLAQMLGLEQELEEPFPILRYQKQRIAKDSARHYAPPSDFPFPEEYALNKWTGKSELPSLFMVRESFASHMIDILGDHFESSTFIFDNWKHKCNETIFQQEPTDIYIQFIWEGLLFQLLEFPPEGAEW